MTLHKYQGKLMSVGSKLREWESDVREGREESEPDVLLVLGGERGNSDRERENGEDRNEEGEKEGFRDVAVGRRE